MNLLLFILLATFSKLEPHHATRGRIINSICFFWIAEKRCRLHVKLNRNIGASAPHCGTMLSFPLGASLCPKVRLRPASAHHSSGISSLRARLRTMRCMPAQSSSAAIGLFRLALELISPSCTKGLSQDIRCRALLLVLVTRATRPVPPDWPGLAVDSYIVRGPLAVLTCRAVRPLLEMPELRPACNRLGAPSLLRAEALEGAAMPSSSRRRRIIR